MAKAQFHKNQRVFVRPVGTWAHIEAINPQWVNGLKEPIHISYDVGMGRDFAPDELDADDSIADTGDQAWRIMRGQNKWRSAEECGHHPFPGTHPVIVTSEREWGGWRVPGSEYDRDPHMIERQARMIVSTPVMLALLAELSALAGDMESDRDTDRETGLPPGLRNIVEQARGIIDDIETP